MYSYTFPLTSELEWGVWSTLRPGRFKSGNDSVPIVQEAGWAPGPVRTGADNLTPTGIRSPVRSARRESLYRLRYPGSQDRQCTIKQYWCAFLQPLLQWYSNKYYISWVCVCSLGYPICIVHAPYCYMWPARLYNIFPHYHINGTIFEKLLNIKYEFWFSQQLVSETFLIPGRNGRDVMKDVYWYLWKVLVILVRF
jgi:hypothetical protein